MPRWTTLLVAVLLTLPAPALAQRQSGGLSGVVTDAEGGGGLRGATVSLSGDRGSVTATSDNAGVFRFPSVEPGTYEVRAELAGFEPQTRGSVVISIAKQISLDFALKLPGAPATVEVVAEAPPVDMTSSFTDTTLSPGLLFHVPLRRSAADLLDYTPGVNNGSAFGGEARSANALLLDGVDTRDPEAGAAWILLSYNWLEEVQVSGLGAPAEYGSYTGAIVNSVTRSGGNRLSGLAEVLWSGRGFSSRNVPESLVQQNPALAETGTLRRQLDLTAQAGGPLHKDRLFFFAGVQRFERDVDPSGPRTSERQVSPRLFLKLGYRPSPADVFVATVERDAVDRRGLESIPSDRAPRNQSSQDTTLGDDLTLNQQAPSLVWSGQWQHTFGPRTFAEAKYTGWSGSYDVRPRTSVSGRFDLETQLFVGSQGLRYQSDQGRHQLNVSISRYAEALGRHDLKLGVEIERSHVGTEFGPQGGLFYFDRDGVPETALSYGYEVSSENRRDSLYLQDAWRVADRLTVNPGFRLDWVRGTEHDLGTFYDDPSWQPRVGLAWDVTGRRRWLVKAHYGRYAETPLTYLWIDALPGFRDEIEFDVSQGTLQEIGRRPATQARVDPRTHQPRLDEITLGLERSLTPDLRVSVTGILRRNRNLIGPVRPGASFSRDSMPNPLTGERITTYVLEDVGQGILLTNPDGYVYRDPDGATIGTARAFRDYRGVMLVVQQRLAAGFQLQGSYVLSKATGTVDNTQFSGIPTLGFGSPNGALINAEGELTNSRRHEVKLLASHQGRELGVSLYFRSLSGRRYTPVQLVFLEPRGSRGLPRENVFDVRVERLLHFGKESRHRLGLFLDALNLFNAHTVTEAETLYFNLSDGLPLGAPTAVIEPRQVSLGLRWSF